MRMSEFSPPPINFREYCKYTREVWADAIAFHRRHSGPAKSGILFGLIGIVGIAVWLLVLRTEPPDTFLSTLFGISVSLAFIVGTFVLGLLLAPPRIIKMERQHAKEAATERDAATARADRIEADSRRAAEELQSAPRQALDEEAQCVRDIDDLLVRADRLEAENPPAQMKPHYHARVLNWMADSFHLIEGRGIQTESNEIKRAMAGMNAPGGSPSVPLIIQYMGSVRSVLQRRKHFGATTKPDHVTQLSLTPSREN